MGCYRAERARSTPKPVQYIAYPLLGVKDTHIADRLRRSILDVLEPPVHLCNPRCRIVKIGGRAKDAAEDGGHVALPVAAEKDVLQVLEEGLGRIGGIYPKTRELAAVCE